MQNPATVLILGYGYSARAVARRLAPRLRVLASTRSAQTAEAARREGVEPVLADPADEAGRARLAEATAEATHVLATAPPGEDGDPFLAAFNGRLPDAPRLEWAGYLSTTGVYGDRGGGWAFEWDAPSPGQARSRRRLAAERAWSAAADARLFRVAGIYGPGRSAIDRVRDGEAVIRDKPGQVFARIHVDDIAGAVAAAIARPQAAGPFNLADDRPCEPGEVIEGAAAMLGLPAPPREAFDPDRVSPMMASFYAECRRVSNARTKASLGWRPAFPTWREGLRAILQAETAGTAGGPG